MCTCDQLLVDTQLLAYAETCMVIYGGTSLQAESSHTNVVRHAVRMHGSLTGHLIGSGSKKADWRVSLGNICAERRWIVTGTPSPDTKLKSKTALLNHTEGLLSFLNALQYKVGFKHVKNGFNGINSVGYQELFYMLSSLMIIHTKQGVGLPEPEKAVRR